MEFLEKSHILCLTQFGFHQNLSTTFYYQILKAQGQSKMLKQFYGYSQRF